MSPFKDGLDFKAHREEVLAIGLFKCETPQIPSSANFQLIGTRFYYYISRNSGKTWFVNKKGTGLKVTKFQEVFESLEPELKEQLLFHLDLFTK